MKKPTDIPSYIVTYPKDVQKVLRKLRAAIRKAAPKAKEGIKYGIPTFMQKGNLVHFGAFKNHIGFYPAPSGIRAFKNALAPYFSAKGSLRFPIDKPLPLALVTKVVKFRVKENTSKKPKKLRVRS